MVKRCLYVILKRKKEYSYKKRSEARKEGRKEGGKEGRKEGRKGARKEQDK